MGEDAVAQFLLIAVRELTLRDTERDERPLAVPQRRLWTLRRRERDTSRYVAGIMPARAPSSRGDRIVVCLTARRHGSRTLRERV
jgi:hypothetical protein